MLEMREILVMRRVEREMAPKCGISLPRDAGDLVGLPAVVWFCVVQLDVQSSADVSPGSSNVRQLDRR